MLKINIHHVPRKLKETTFSLLVHFYSCLLFQIFCHEEKNLVSYICFLLTY
jgi:hypothetical protein